MASCMTVFLLLSISCAPLTHCHSVIQQNNIFAAIDHMKPLVDLEKMLVSHVRNYVARQREILHDLLPIKEEIEDAVHLVDNQTTLGYLKNPINNFKLAKRLTEDWRDIHSYMSEVDAAASPTKQIEDGFALDWENLQSTWLDTYNSNVVPKSRWTNSSEIHTTSESTWWQVYRSHTPTSKDIDGATAAFIRLQDTYNVTAWEFAEGKVSFLRPFKLQLTAEDCLAVAVWCLSNTRYVRMREWLHEAERLINDPTMPHRHGDITSQQVNERLAYSFYLEKDFASAVKYIEKVLAEDATITRYAQSWELYSYYLQYKDVPPPEETGYVALAQARLDEVQSSTYLQACNNLENKPIGYKDIRNIRCFVKQDHPLLILKPIKVTQMHDNPDVFILHNILTKEKIEEWKDIATPRIKVAKVIDRESNKLVEADYRVSKSMFLLPDVPDDMKIDRQLHPLFEAVTGLSMKYSETLQINNYGLGGQYELHHDYGEKGTYLATDRFGNRMATLLLYMSGVEYGGHTVFPDLGLSLNPSEGDAVFWYNLHRNGTGFYETRHASCPVLAGSKWVANKWIRNAGNEFSRPCALHQFE